MIVKPGTGLQQILQREVQHLFSNFCFGTYTNTVTSCIESRIQHFEDVIKFLIQNQIIILNFIIS